MSTQMHVDGWEVAHAEFCSGDPDDTFRALLVGLRQAGAVLTVVDRGERVVIFEDPAETFCRRAMVVASNGGSFIVSGVPADLPLPSGGLQAQLGIVRPRSGEGH